MRSSLVLFRHLKSLRTGFIRPYSSLSAFQLRLRDLPLADLDMPRDWNVTFLGTCSGGGPCRTRNCSSLVADVGDHGELWMVDCAEGTLRQFDLQPNPRHQRHGKYSQEPQFNSLPANSTKVKKVFITHMHADHIMGIVPLIRRLCYAPDHKVEAARANPHPTLEIYGPAGIRNFIRFILKATHTNIAHKYVVHELLFDSDEVTPCDSDVRAPAEMVGKDIRQVEGLWSNVTSTVGSHDKVVVDAGPIEHRDPCIGYVFRETREPQRKIVVLGDTSDPTGILPLCDQPTLLIHEATDAYMTSDINPYERRTQEVIYARSLDRGHSIPAQAGAFARKIGAQGLVLNHIGSRFPGGNGTQASIIWELERQATEAWGVEDRSAIAAYDFLNIQLDGVPHSVVHDEQSKPSSSEGKRKLEEDESEGAQKNRYDDDSGRSGENRQALGRDGGRRDGQYEKRQRRHSSHQPDGRRDKHREGGEARYERNEQRH